MKKDNFTLRYKVSLRQNLLKQIDAPVVMETHGGYGGIWRRCYSHLDTGVVFEKDPAKAGKLALQRPTWAVYECDCEQALGDGVGFHLPVNFLDVDPYGDPWPIIEAFFSANRDGPSKLLIAVNDGLRQKIKMNGGWDVESMKDMVSKIGAANMYKDYLAVCQMLMEEKAGRRGYSLTGWTGYYCGHAKQMSHYGAVLTRK